MYWIILAIVIIMLIICNRNILITKKAVNFQLHKSYIVDTNGIKENFQIVESTPFTFFIQIRNFDNLKEYFLKEFHLEIPDIDFDYDDSYMAISIGREIKELSYNGYLKGLNTPNTFAKAEITFAEEYYENIMYVYSMEKIFFTSSLVNDATKFYVIQGSKKLFLGNTIFDINEIKKDERQGM